MMVLSDFAPHLESVFNVYIGETDPMPITLIEAKALQPQPPPLRPDPFELRFRGPGPAYLNQMIHSVSHPTMGEFQLFLVPIGVDGDGFLYQAIFN